MLVEYETAAAVRGGELCLDRTGDVVLRLRQVERETLRKLLEQAPLPSFLLRYDIGERGRVERFRAELYRALG